ncbi:MAG: hypothetical protein GC172_05960 [Phycisphaera sp.]|nr:hypothetical protein [Phycisphaera sp.]
MGPIGWAIAIIILQAVIGTLAKKAQEKRNAEARRAAQQAASAGGGPSAPPASPRQTKTTVRVERKDPRTAETATSAQRVVVRPPTAPPTRATPTMPPRGAAPLDPAVAMARAAEEARAAAEARAAREARAVERARAEASQRNRAATGSTRGQVRTVQPSKDRFSVKAKPGTRGGQQPGRPPVPAPAEREEYAALQSTKRVRESLERVRAAERRVGGGHETGAVSESDKAARRASNRAAALRTLLSSRDRVREGVVLAEVLGAPRSMRPFGAV